MNEYEDLLIQLENLIRKYNLKLILSCLAHICVVKAKILRTGKQPDIYQLKEAHKLEVDALSLSNIEIESGIKQWLAQ